MSVTILTGDCIQSMRSLPTGIVNMCVTSPPYWGLRDYGHNGQIGQEDSPQAFASKMVEVFSEVWRILRDDGTLWLNLGDSYAAQRGGTQMPAETLAGGENGKGDEDSYRGRQIISPKTEAGQEGVDSRLKPVAHRNARGYGLKHKDLVGIPWRVAFALQEAGWYLRQDIIWHKPNPMPESVRDRCTKAHEYLFLLAKSEKYYFDHLAMKEPAVGGAKGSKFNTGKTAEHQENRSSDAERVEDGTRNRRSVWSVNTKPYREAHFATFPTTLIEPCILAGCPSGGTVLDPFGGSGTTALVASQHGRNAILCELNPDYVSLARKRCGLPEPLSAEDFEL